MVKVSAAILIVLGAIAAIVLVGFFVYLYSGIQMRAWLNEIVKYIKELDLNEHE